MYFYVIMPIGADPAAMQKQELIRTIAATRNLTPHFPKYETQQSSFDLKSTLDDLKGAWFVLTDLSLARPSCYYELGLAEALGKEVYLIAQQGTEVHQTAARVSINFYEDLQDLKNIIAELMDRVT